MGNSVFSFIKHIFGLTFPYNIIKSLHINIYNVNMNSYFF